MKKIFKDYLQEKPATVPSVDFPNNDKPKCEKLFTKGLWAFKKQEKK